MLSDVLEWPVSGFPFFVGKVYKAWLWKGLEAILDGRRFPYVLKDAQNGQAARSSMLDVCWINLSWAGACPLLARRRRIAGRFRLVLARGRYGTPIGSSHAGAVGAAPPRTPVGVKRKGVEVKNARM